MTPETNETPHLAPWFTPTTVYGSSSNNKSLADGNIWSSLPSPYASKPFFPVYEWVPESDSDAKKEWVTKMTVILRRSVP